MKSFKSSDSVSFGPYILSAGNLSRFAHFQLKPQMFTVNLSLILCLQCIKKVQCEHITLRKSAGITSSSIKINKSGQNDRGDRNLHLSSSFFFCQSLLNLAKSVKTPIQHP